MVRVLNSNIAIVGGGHICKNMLELLLSDHFEDCRPTIMGVADTNAQAEGLVYAKERGIFTTGDFREFYALEELHILMELTADTQLGSVIKKEKPEGVEVIDRVDARNVWSALQLEAEKRIALKELRKNNFDAAEIDRLFERFADRLAEVLKERGERSVEIERGLIKSERALSQIIEGSTIPTFVLNMDHVVTHWNKAMEKVTGIKADTMVGGSRPAIAFWGEERPTLADVILDQIGEDEIRKLYGEQWRKSTLIEEAYEAEVFFPRMGESGKWCWFTAAPIKAPDGSIVGAIETLWDKTEDKKAEHEREQHNRELTTLCSIYTALNAPLDLEERINQSVQEVMDFLSADGLCIYLMEDDDKYHLRYCEGLSERVYQKIQAADENSVIQRVADTNEFMIYEDLPDDCPDEICLFEEEKLVSLAYIPISSKERGAFGVIRIGSKNPGHFTRDLKSVLELIGNRIGVAIENATLQDQYIKSEEKYRTLFNSDPHPIFILSRNTYKILDMNQRAEDSYGYTADELLKTSFLQLGDENDQELTGGLKNLSENNSLLFTKKRHYRKGGEPFFVNINISYAKYGKADVIVAATTDITEVVEKETQLIQAGKMTTLGVMAAGMAHEINQPLNVIQVCADFFLKMLNRGQKIEDEDLRTMANDIVANVERASGVIKHVRDFARQSEPVRTRVNINDPVKDVFKVLGHQLKVHDVDVKLDLDADIPYILAEHNRLEQVFINLVSNAIDAMDEKDSRPEFSDKQKQLTIRSRVENGHVCVKVIDTGTGMSEDVKNKIFEPFYTTKKVGKGTGLGVSISYGIVQDYKGSIEIESELGKGTTFILKFPPASEA
ncbi:MAG: PAS domain S-box protein [Desulfobacterales bacterium]|jgi:PAS domain S-box-containing protein